MLKDVRENALLDRPPEEVQLPDSGFIDGRGARDDETDTLAPTEGVKEFLAVSLEFALVLEVDNELALLQDVRNIELLGVVRDEPFDNAEADGGRAGQKGEDRLNASRLVVELLEPADDVVLLALNAVLEGVTR